MKMRLAELKVSKNWWDDRPTARPSLRCLNCV